MVAARALAEEAIKDFNSPLSSGQTIFQYPQYRAFAIGVESSNPSQVVPRKYLYWARARGINHLVRDQAFQSSTLAMTWRGDHIETVFFIAARPRQKATAMLEADWTLVDLIDSC